MSSRPVVAPRPVGLIRSPPPSTKSSTLKTTMHFVVNSSSLSARSRALCSNGRPTLVAFSNTADLMGRLGSFLLLYNEYPVLLRSEAVSLTDGFSFPSMLNSQKNRNALPFVLIHILSCVPPPHHIFDFRHFSCVGETCGHFSVFSIHETETQKNRLDERIGNVCSGVHPRSRVARTHAAVEAGSRTPHAQIDGTSVIP